MNLSFSATNEGYGKLDKDGDMVITIKPSETLDLNHLSYFHLRDDTSLQILGAKKDLNVLGFVKEISIKSEISFKFQASHDIDLNVLFALCKDPEPWQVRLDDKQTSLQDFGTVVKVEHHGKNEVLGIAAEMVNTFGLDGAQKILKVASKAKSER
ncbi:MAG: hypothetical protein Q8O19_04135 [Rectinemataceae bacterium]|nr:hypothetical protein [Rectinemataceae bacterium]